MGSNFLIEASNVFLERGDAVLGEFRDVVLQDNSVVVSLLDAFMYRGQSVEDTQRGTSVRGTIGGFVYLGEVAQYDLLVRDRVLKVFERNPRFVDGASRGELFATVAPEDVVILVG
jgi:hypothetical protein